MKRLCIYLHLSNKVFVDVSSPVCLPPLKRLLLVFVVYKDDDYVVRLLSSCPILEYLYVLQHEQDNVTKFSVKVPSLETLIYFYRKAKVLDEEDIGRSLAIDSKILKKFFIADYSTNSCSIENKPSFDKAVIYVYSYPDDKFMRSLSSVRYLEIRLSVATVLFTSLLFILYLFIVMIYISNSYLRVVVFIAYSVLPRH